MAHLGQVLQLESLALRAVEVVADGEEDRENGAEGGGAPEGLDAHL